MKQLLLMLCLFCSLGMQAQDMKTLFVNLPDSLSPLLTKVNRADFGDFLASDMKAEVKNRFGKPSEMKQLTDDYLYLQVSSSVSAEMKLLPLNDSVKVICVVRTYAAPAEDSKISFYTTDWRELPSENFIALPSEDLFYRTPVNGQQADSLKNLRIHADMYLLKARLSADSDMISFSYGTFDYLDKETAGKLKPYLREAPLCYEWKGGRFVVSESTPSVLEK